MFELIELKDKFADDTINEWNRQINSFTSDEDLILESSYRSKLNYLSNNENAVFYGLKAQDKDHALSILEMTLRRPAGSETGLRLLNITLEPDLDAENRNIGDDMQYAIKVIATSIVRAFSLTYNEIPAKTFKIYARTDSTMTILKFVSAAISDAEKLSDKLETRFEGRWLVIDKLL